MPLILPGNVASATAAAGYDVANSVRLNSADSPKLAKTPGGAGNRRTWTFSCWCKKDYADASNLLCLFGSRVDGSDNVHFGFSGDQLELKIEISDTVTRVKSAAFFIDCSSWYHIVAKVDTTQATAANRVKLYVNGVVISHFATEQYPAENGDTSTNNACAHTVGDSGNNSHYFPGYMAEVCLIDGSALAPTSFGEYDSDSPSIWKPIDVSGLSFGTNGFYLDFEASDNLGNDANGGTDLDETNLAATDQTTDTPTNSFATWNSLTNRDAGNGTWTEGNLRIVASGGDVSRYCTHPIPLNFKFYFEVKAPIVGAQAGCGVTSVHDPSGARTKVGDHSTGYGWKFRGAASVVQYFNASTASNHATSNPSDDSIMGFAVDCANGRMHMSIDGTYLDSSDPTDNDPNSVVTGFSTTVPQYLHTSLDTRGASQPIMEFNFGNPIHSISSGNADANGYGNFEFAVPSGYLAFCTKNMADF